MESSTGCGSNWGQETSCQLVLLDSARCVSNGQRLGCSSETSSRSAGTLSRSPACLPCRIKNKVSPVALKGKNGRKEEELMLIVHCSRREAEESCQKLLSLLKHLLHRLHGVASLVRELVIICPSWWIIWKQSSADEWSSALMCQKNKVFQYSWRLLSVQTHE